MLIKDSRRSVPNSTPCFLSEKFFSARIILAFAIFKRGMNSLPKFFVPFYLPVYWQVDGKKVVKQIIYGPFDNHE